MAGWCFQSGAQSGPKERGREGADYLCSSLAWVAEAPPQHRVGSAGRRQLGYKVRLFLK